MTRFEEAAMEVIERHSQGAYPNEGCGFLLGTPGETVTVHEAMPASNTNQERAQDRYTIDPAEFMTAERIAAGTGWSVVGIYHSHPDHPSAPSQFDTDRAWPSYRYLIVAVDQGQVTSRRCWVLEESEPKRFREEPVEVEEGAAWGSR